MRKLRRLAQPAVDWFVPVAALPPAWAPAVGRPRAAVSPEQSPPPTNAGPASCRMKIGNACWRGPPVAGSGFVVSPEAMNTQPRESTELVKKSPSRRSCPVAAHVVPPWQTPLSWIGRPTASTLSIVGEGVSALRIVDDMMRIFAAWQSRSTSLSLWYQTMLMLPASPAAIHGQKPRALGGAATVIGADHVAPMSFEYAYW